MICSELYSAPRACSCQECGWPIPVGDMVELVTAPAECGPFCSRKCRDAAIDRNMRRPFAVLEALHRTGCDECGSGMAPLLLEHGRKLCTSCWLLSVD